MSPSSSTVESGMPWQMTSLRDVQMDLGNPRYSRQEGYAPWSHMYSWAIRSSSSVVTPGFASAPAACRARAAICPASRTSSTSSGV